MAEGNFFSNFNEMLRARAEGRRSPRVPQLGGVLYLDQPRVQKPEPAGPPMAKTAADYLGIARRRWPLIAGAATLFTCAGAVATSSLPTAYRADAVLLLDTRNGQADLNAAAAAPRPFDATAVRGEMEVLNSRDMARAVVEKLRLADRPGIVRIDASAQDPTAAPRVEAAVARLLGRLSVQNDGRSPVVKIGIAAATPQLAAAIANAYAEAYLAHQIAAKNEATRRASDGLERQIAILHRQVAENEQQTALYKEQHGLAATRGATVTAQEVAEINSQLIAAHGDRVQKEAALRSARQVLDSPGGAEAAGQVLGSPLIQHLREQEADLMRRAAELSTRYRPAHPTMVRMAAEIADLHRKLADEAGRVVRAMADAASAARTREEALKANLAELSQSTTRQEGTSTRLRELEHEGDATRTLLDSLLARFEQISAQQGLQQPDAQILSRAEPSAARPVPDKRRLYATAVFLSVVLGVFLAVALEFADASFRRPDEIEELTGLPVLGVIPAGAAQRSRPGKRHRAEAVLSEALRDVRSGLRQSLAGAPLGVMLVTSAGDDEGKTFFAVGLGRSVVRAGLRCLVIDCHFQRPGLDRLLSPAPARDLPVAAGYPQIHVDGASALHYIPAPAAEQRRLLRSQDLFDSVEMGNYIRRMRGHYDLIILDAPPVQAVGDLVPLSRLADTALFLIRWGRTPRRAATSALRVLALRGVSLAGIVLSRVDLRRYATYGQGAYIRHLQNASASAAGR